MRKESLKVVKCDDCQKPYFEVIDAHGDLIDSGLTEWKGLKLCDDCMEKPEPKTEQQKEMDRIRNVRYPTFSVSSITGLRLSKNLNQGGIGWQRKRN